MIRTALLSVVFLFPSMAVAQEGPAADRLVACLVGQSVLLVMDGLDVPTAFSAAWEVCDPLAADVPVEYDGIDFDGLEGLDELAYHTVQDLADNLGVCKVL